MNNTFLMKIFNTFNDLLKYIPKLILGIKFLFFTSFFDNLHFQRIFTLEKSPLDANYITI